MPSLAYYLCGHGAKKGEFLLTSATNTFPSQLQAQLQSCNRNVSKIFNSVPNRYWSMSQKYGMTALASVQK